MAKASATQSFDAMNAQLPTERRVDVQLTIGWLHRFSKRLEPRSLKSYGESGDVNQAVVHTSLLNWRSELDGYSSDN